MFAATESEIVGLGIEEPAPAPADPDDLVALLARSEVAALMHAFSPGTSPPPVRIPIFTRPPPIVRSVRQPRRSRRSGGQVRRDRVETRECIGPVAGPIMPSMTPGKRMRHPSHRSRARPRGPPRRVARGRPRPRAAPRATRGPARDPAVCSSCMPACTGCSCYERLERVAGRGWLAFVDAQRAVDEAVRAADAAEADLRIRVRSAYQLGPGATLEALLGAATLRGSRLHLRVHRADDLPRGRGPARFRRRAGDRRWRGARRSRRAAERLEPRLRGAPRAARRDGGDDRRGGRDRGAGGDRGAGPRGVEPAARSPRRRRGMRDLGIIDYRQDQSHLLALLGPTGGRTCETPEGLVPTGECSRATRRGTGGSSAASRPRPARSSTRGCSPRRTAGSRSARSSASATGTAARSCSSTTAARTDDWSA